MIASDPTRSPSRNVVLTGFMGTGKTTVGRLLAVRLGYGFVDTDSVIETRHGPIPDIFETLGEEAFRAMERRVAEEIAADDSLVVSTGGRLMLDPTNAAVLGEQADVFCLSADVDEVIRRVTAADDAAQRPLLAGPDSEQRIRELLDERRGQYGQFIQIDTTGRSPDEVVTAILRALDR